MQQKIIRCKEFPKLDSNQGNRAARDITSGLLRQYPLGKLV